MINEIGQFKEYIAAERSVFNKRLVGRGAAFADIDNDGDQDVLVTTNNGPAWLWRNESTFGRALQITLEGGQSSRSAVGASVTTVAGSNRQYRTRSRCSRRPVLP